MSDDLATYETMQANAEREGDIVTRARKIALQQGHMDVEHIVICTDGARVPVWKFYYEAARLQLA